MSATATRPLPTSVGTGLRALAVFVVVATVALAAALFTGATGVFNVLVFVLFAVLWVCFAAALGFRQAGLHELWQAFRRRNIFVQAVGWLLFLPLTAALFVWERRWHVGIRFLLVLAIALVNLLMFFPRG